MPRNISLDQPLLEQESVREILNLLTEEVNPRVNLEDVLKVARTIIRAELVACNCAPNELLSLRINHVVSSIESQNEVTSIEWRQLIEKVDDTESTSELQSPIASKFWTNLGIRIKEMSTATSLKPTDFSMLSNFSSFAAIGVDDCDADGFVPGSNPKQKCYSTSKPID